MSGRGEDDIGVMRRIATMAVLAFGLPACAASPGADGTPGPAGGGIPRAIQTQTYVPGGSAAPGRTFAESAPPAQRPETPPPQRRGSSSPPPFTPYTGVPATPQPGASTDRAVSDFKRDQTRQELDRLNNFPTPMTPEPWRQREIMNRQLDLDRQELIRR